ncbi:hypothetical protein WMF31_10370 [Sorangium sp. So ce1036]|uniref:hypothetical protein n=1 Tax=Sorangium sp. So ce1036 TaxID=3133328 RepID=UPI003F0C6F5F
MDRLQLESHAVVLQRERRARRLAWALLLVGLALTAAAPPAAALTQFMIGGAGAFLLMRAFGKTPTPRRGSARPATVVAEDGDLVIQQAGQRTLLARRELENGWIDAFGGHHHVVLRKKGGDVLWVRVRDADEAGLLLRAAGFAADQHAFRMRLVSVLSERLSHRARAALIVLASLFLYPLVGLAPLAWALGGATVFLGALLVLLVLVYPILQLVMPRTALVGTDGVVIQGIATRRLIPITEVAGARADARGVWLDHVGGTSILLPTVARMTASHGAAPLVHLGADTRVLLARVQEVMASRGHAGTSARLGALDRRGRAFEDWRGALGRLAHGDAGGGSYRETALDVDDLARVLEDGAAPAERRIAAAVALASSGDPALKRRVRIAAGTCADQALRDAIERAAEEELQERDVDRVLRLRAD